MSHYHCILPKVTPTLFNLTEYKKKIKKNVVLQNLDPSLLHIFMRDYKRTIKSEQFGFEFDLLAELNMPEESDDVDTCCKRHLIELVMRRQKLLNLTLSNLNKELASVDNNLATLETLLAKTATASEVKLFVRSVSKISVIVNLIFGLQLRLCDYSPTISLSMVRRRLSEASDIKLLHDISLHTMGRIVRDRLGVVRQMECRHMVKNKQKLGCKIKIVKMELHYLETQMKLIHLLF